MPTIFAEIRVAICTSLLRACASFFLSASSFFLPAAFLRSASSFFSRAFRSLGMWGNAQPSRNSPLTAPIATRGAIGAVRGRLREAWLFFNLDFYVLFSLFNFLLPRKHIIVCIPCKSLEDSQWLRRR